MARVRAKTAARDYGGQHQAIRAALAPLVAAGLATCWRCGTAIAPGAPWDLGHDDVTHQRRGPEHRKCNRSAGASKGNMQRGQGTRATGRPATAARW